MTASRRPHGGWPAALAVAAGIAAAATVGVVAFGGIVATAARPSGDEEHAPSAPLPAGRPSASLAVVAPHVPGASVPASAPVPSPAPPTPVASTTPPAEVALVPVVSTGSVDRSIARSTLARLLAGPAGGRRVLVSAPDLTALAASLGVSPGAAVRSMTPGRVLAAIAADPSAIGIVRATDVTPAVRALAVDGAALFGALRVRSLEAWPLVVPQVAPATAAFDPANAWTLVAGGDVMLDRGVYREAVLRGKGADLPWDGGTARIVGTRCCGAAGALLPVGRRTGDAGGLRELLRAADIALVNLEGPAPDAFSFHPDGLVFSFDPALLAGLRRAGIDAVSLANNHIANAGATGIADTARHLDALHVGHAGAGATLAAARRPVILAAGGLRIAFLAYDAIRPDLAAGSDRAGTAPLRLDLARSDIRAARSAGADIVIVMPHWGTEYTDAVTPEQRREAAALVAAGADAVIGSHSHWAGPVETIRGRPVLYSLGDLVFELYHDRRTLESVVADMTFVGRRLVQLDLHPTLIVDGVQPNLLDPAGDGAAILADISRASTRLSRVP